MKLLVAFLLLLAPSAIAQSQTGKPTIPDRTVGESRTTVQDELKRKTVQQNVQEKTSSNKKSDYQRKQDESTELSREEPDKRAPHIESEFEKLVRESVGHPLTVFGQDMFRDVPSTFAPVDRIPVTADYVIGPGDELLLRVWGSVDIDLQLLVDRNGQVHIPKVGTLNVAGLRYEQLPGYMRSCVGRIFREFDLTVTLGELRSIQVFVVGYANRPGSYTVSSLSTLVNAVFAAGGTSPTGSMRSIQLRRGGRTVAEFDLYDLLLLGDKSKDVPLLPGDVIFIPPVGTIVAIDGSVQAPGIYEMKSTSTLADIVQVAGGLSPAAATKRVSIERFRGGHGRLIVEAQLDGEGLRKQLANGDVIRIEAVPPKFEETITLRGNVVTPGRYAFRSGMKVRDLIGSREFLITREYWSTQNRLTTPEAPSGDGDEKSSTKGDGSTRASQGEAQLRNEVQRNGSDINWAYALVQRIQPDLSTQLLPFNLGRALDQSDSADNLELRSGDVITIFSQTDVAVPANLQSRYVRLEGEINAAGVYRVETGESLREILRRAGGLTQDAYLFAAQFTRESVKSEQTERYKRYLDDLEQELARHAAEPARDKQDAEEKQLEIDRQKRLVQELRKVQPTGRIVLGLKPGDRELADLPELEMEDGDRFFIPRQPATVNVMGAVYNENAFLFAKGLSVKSYLQRAGGGTREADEKNTFVLRADGSLVAHRTWTGNKTGLRDVLPGDTIVVPLHMERTSFMRNLRDWSQVLSQFALGAAAIRVLQN
jgi:protein involved in polysaccharide export with SLBB domain